MDNQSIYIIFSNPAEERPDSDFNFMVTLLLSKTYVRQIKAEAH